MSRKPRWTKNPPTEQGDYWHWNGDEDCAPVVLSIMWSGTSEKCFVSTGNTGYENNPIDCDELGGWWQHIPAPTPPKEKR